MGWRASSAVVVVVAVVAVGVCTGRDSHDNRQNHNKAQDHQSNAADEASNVEAKSNSPVGLSRSIVTPTIFILCLRSEEMKVDL